MIGLRSAQTGVSHSSSKKRWHVDASTPSARVVSDLDEGVELNEGDDTPRKEHTRSFITPLSTSPVWLPRTNIAVRSFSISLGARASSARLERAFRGTLEIFPQQEQWMIFDEGRTWLATSFLGRFQTDLFAAQPPQHSSRLRIPSSCKGIPLEGTLRPRTRKVVAAPVSLFGVCVIFLHRHSHNGR